MFLRDPSLSVSDGEMFEIFYPFNLVLLICLLFLGWGAIFIRIVLCDCKPEPRKCYLKFKGLTSPVSGGELEFAFYDDRSTPSPPHSGFEKDFRLRTASQQQQSQYGEVT